MKKIFSMLLFGFLSLSVSSQTAVSVAGFFPLPEQVSRGSGRTVYNFNLGWRFHRGDVAGAEAAVFDDLQWEVVSIPHSVQLMPSEASGCRNYQGIVNVLLCLNLPKERMCQFTLKPLWVNKCFI